jgi:ABC-2 type transport system ATP-binding protein
MINVHGISKNYGATAALSELSFELGQGEILGLLGPNGAGKTTILRILTGFMPPDSGRVELAGENIHDRGRSLRARTGYLPERNPLYTELSVGASLDLFGGLYGLQGKELQSARGRVLESCGLSGMERRLVGNLSKGYRQRLGLAQALIHDPDIIFLDEPTSGLDPANVKELRDLILSFAGQKTVILSTHVLSEVEATCDRVLILDQGRVVLSGSLSELGEGGREQSTIFEIRVSHPTGQIDWQNAPGVENIKGLPADNSWLITLPDREQAPAALAAWLVVQGVSLHEMHPRKGGLEELFIRVTGGEGEL